MRTSTITVMLIGGLFVKAAAALPSAIADERAGSKEKEAVSLETVLNWLPADTEALSVAQSFNLQLIDYSAVTPSTPDWLLLLLRDSAMQPLRDLREGKYAKPLIGKRAGITLSAQRAFEVFDFWGSTRTQGCDVLIFQDDLGSTGAALERTWRQECKQVETVDGQSVYCFERCGPRKSYMKDVPWEGTFICRPAPNILLFANQMDFLKTVLERRRVKAKDRALPDRLPFWRAVDRKAPAWMVRRAQAKTAAGQQAAAWTLAIDKPPGLLVLNFSPDDAQSAAVSRTAASRIADWAKTFELVWSLKPASDGSTRLEVRLPKPNPDDPNGWVAFGFFFVKVVTDPIVPAAE
jgi:hypothetical protein